MSFLNPAATIKGFGLKKGMFVADFGCGAGHFSLAAAKIVGAEGSVYCIDIHESVLHVIEGHKKMDGLVQIKTVCADLEKENGSGLPESSQDFVLISNTLHQADSPEAVLAEAYRVLKSGGRAAIIDWVEKSHFGPNHRISKSKVEQTAEAQGLKKEREFDAGMAHYGLMFAKNI